MIRETVCGLWTVHFHFVPRRKHRVHCKEGSIND